MELFPVAIGSIDGVGDNRVGNLEGAVAVGNVRTPALAGSTIAARQRPASSRTIGPTDRATIRNGAVDGCQLALASVKEITAPSRAARSSGASTNTAVRATATIATIRAIGKKGAVD